MIARRITSIVAIVMVLLVIRAGLQPMRSLDVEFATPAPRSSSQAIPTAPDPSGGGGWASGTPATTSGAPDRPVTRTATSAGGPSGAPLTRPAIRGRGGISEADPTPGPVASASRPAGGVVSAPSRRPTPTKLPARLHLSPSGPTSLVVGLASWYCSPGRSACTVGYDPSCTCAAAGPALRAALGPNWRRRVVTVSTGRASVAVRLVDFCACGSRVLDLFAYPFSMLAPLSTGLVDVEVSW